MDAREPRLPPGFRNPDRQLTILAWLGCWLVCPPLLLAWTPGCFSFPDSPMDDRNMPDGLAEELEDAGIHFRSRQHPGVGEILILDPAA